MKGYSTDINLLKTAASLLNTVATFCFTAAWFLIWCSSSVLEPAFITVAEDDSQVHVAGYFVKWKSCSTQNLKYAVVCLKGLTLMKDFEFPPQLENLHNLQSKNVFEVNQLFYLDLKVGSLEVQLIFKRTAKTVQLGRFMCLQKQLCSTCLFCPLWAERQQLCLWIFDFTMLMVFIYL